MPPGTRNALVPPSPNYLRDAGEFTGGLLRGSSTALMGGLQMRDQLALDAYRSQQAGSLQGVYADAWRAAQEAAANPSMITDAVGNSLRGMWTRAKSGPAGLGEVVGENIDPRNFLKPRKALRKELDVYHGTPHTFDPETGAPLGRFRSEKIGTGEGAQVYGRGLYFAEHPDVAGEYRQIAGNLPSHVGGGFAMSDAAAAKLDKLASSLSLKSEYDRGIFGVYDDLRGGEFTPDILKRRLKKELDAGEIEPEYYNGAMQGFKNAEKVFAETKGSLYKVDLPDAKIAQMLDWDKPLSQQPEIYRKVLADKQWRNRFQFRTDAQVGEITGKELYEMGHDQTQRLGIPGIKYLDQGSRASGKGTRNFVVFPGEEQHLNILSRD